MMRALDATRNGAILKSDWLPLVGDEDVYLLDTNTDIHRVVGRVAALGPRGFRVVFVEPSSAFLEAWEQAVLREAIRSVSSSSRQHTERMTTAWDGH